MKQHQCTVLAVDQGRRSGWAIFRRGELMASGKAVNHTQRISAVEGASLVASKAKTQLVVCLEGHDHMPASMGANTATLIGLGAARGRWQECAEMWGIPSKRVVEIGVADWRRRVFGKQRKLRRSVVKQMAINAAKVLYNVDCEDDEAEAICIGSCAFNHPVVGAAVRPEFRGLDYEPELARYRHGEKSRTKQGRHQAGPDREGPDEAG